MTSTIPCPEVCIELQMPSRSHMASYNSSVLQDMNTKLLQTLVPGVPTTNAVDRPDLTWLTDWMTNVTGPNYDILPPTSTLEAHIFLLRACQVLQLQPSIDTMTKRLKSHLDDSSLMPQGVQLMWLAFGPSSENIDAIAGNIAKFDFGTAGMIQSYLTDEMDVPLEQGQKILDRVAFWKQEFDLDREEEEWQKEHLQSQGRTNMFRRTRDILKDMLCF